jgi:hypothetical protein
VPAPVAYPLQICTAETIPAAALQLTTVALLLDCLTTQESRIRAEIAGIEKDTGFRLRVLAQNYPETPGED